eukprot:Gb_36101 [translate_table: standard]
MDLKSKNVLVVDLPTSKLFLPGKFVQQYLCYLLPALKRIREGESEQQSSSKWELIRFEVDMALALSARGFSWSHALMSNLEKVSMFSKLNEELVGTKVRISPIQPSLKTVSLNANNSWGNNNAGSLEAKFLKRKPKNKCVCITPKKYIKRECCKMSSIKSRGQANSCTLQGKTGHQFNDKKCLLNTVKSLSKRKTLSLRNEEYRRVTKLYCAKSVGTVSKLHRKFKGKRALDSRIQTLKALTPGGSDMETDVLLEELGNYIMSLKLQVQILHHLTDDSVIILPN